MKLVLAAGWFIPGEELTVYRTHLNMVGGPAYLSIEGKYSRAYAIFDCLDWKYLSNQEQLQTLTLHMREAYMGLPYKRMEEE